MPIIYNSNFATGAGAAMREFAPVNKSVRDTMFKLEELRMREEAMDQREAQFRTRLEQQARQFEAAQGQQATQFDRQQSLRELQQAQRDQLAEVGLARQAELDAYQKEQDQLARDFAGEQLELKRLEAQRAHEARLKNLELSERELEARTGTNSKARQQELEFYYDSVPDEAKFSPTAAGFAQAIAALQGVVQRGESFGEEEGDGVDVFTLDEAAQIEKALNDYLGIDIARDGLPSQEELEANPGFGPAMAVLGRALATGQNRLLDHSINKGYGDWLSSSERLHEDFFDSKQGAELTAEVVGHYNDALQLRGEDRAQAISALEVAKMNWTQAAKLQEDKAYVTNLIRKELATQKEKGSSSYDLDVEDETNKLLARLNSNSFQGNPNDILMEARILYDPTFRAAADFGRRQVEDEIVQGQAATPSNLPVEDVASPQPRPEVTTDTRTPSTGFRVKPSKDEHPAVTAYREYLSRIGQKKDTPEARAAFFKTPAGRKFKENAKKRKVKEDLRRQTEATGTSSDQLNITFGG
jgi:hypothetical protein